jgi:hypothetical protein
MRQVRSLKPLKLEARANAASAQVVEPVPVREILEAPAAVVTGTDELVPVRVMSSATSRFAKCNDSLGLRASATENALQGKSRHSGFAGRPRSLQHLGQDISPLFRAADRSRPNLGIGFRLGIETFGKRTNRQPSFSLRYFDFVRSTSFILSFRPQWTH